LNEQETAVFHGNLLRGASVDQGMDLIDDLLEMEETDVRRGDGREIIESSNGWTSGSEMREELYAMSLMLLNGM
jgi:hypothetical protein